MTTRLKAYIRRTVLASAREYAYPAKRRTKESTQSAFRDAMHGTDTGWWTDLIYTRDVIDLFNRYRSDVAAAIRDYCNEVGLGVGNTADRDGYYTFADIIASTARRQTWERYRTVNDRISHEAEAACFGIRFAIEYLCGEVASELGIEI